MLNLPAAADAEPGLLHRLFEQRVAQDPAAIALTFQNQQLDYATLNARANRLAHHLIARGVRPDTLVAVLLPRGVDLIVAMLAILKAGGAYVPLDPGYPMAALTYQLSDCQPLLLLGNVDTTALVAELGALPILLNINAVLNECESLHGPADGNPDPVPLGLQSRHLAYVIYTSGSSGRPKGVMVEHAQVVRLFSASAAGFGFDSTDVWTLFHSCAFDFSVWEIWGALLHGARLVVVPLAIARAPDAFHALMCEQGVTILNQTPSAFRQLLAAQTLSTARHRLRYIVFGGEALTAGLLAAWYARNAPEATRLVNMYGITETTVHVTYQALGPAEAALDGLCPIGRALPDLRLYLLDAALRPVEAGQTGELFVGGAGLARGYLHQPALTAQRFIADPWAGVAGARMYRSGDLGRMRADGSLEYLGRNDAQVKIRGHRIETGEIESVLLRCGGVAQCVVIAKADASGEARLVAYVVRTDASLTNAALRVFATAHLPAFMVPAAWVWVPTLPVTPNGKLDRDALPAPARARPELGPRYAAPQGAVEESLCALFAELTEVAPVGRDDNFFALGGSSLGVMRLVTRIFEHTGSDVAAARIFNQPTPVAVALLVMPDASQLASAPGCPVVAAPTLSVPELPVPFLPVTPVPVPELPVPVLPVVPVPMPELPVPVLPLPGSPLTAQAEAATAIAIVAMSGRFPGATDVEALWQLLHDGADGICHFGPGQLDASIAPALAADPAYVSARGVIDGADCFDAAFFGISPSEASIMDPQHRIFLQLCWDCLERGGYVPDTVNVPVGVFAGAFGDSYLQRHVRAHPEVVERAGALALMLANDRDFLSTRVAHRLNLTGPAVSVQTACSTSLVAVVQAVNSLRAGQCAMALAGGVAISCPPRSGYLYEEGAMLSRDGRTRTFDREATGTVFSDGAGVVLLKPLKQPLADGDPVLAVIRGVGINNDGGRKASFTAPAIDGQAAVIAAALDDASLSAAQISYVEAHGTATPLGDPIEIAALTQAYRRHTDATGFCRIGSIKSNLGHLTSAAGVAGLIKTTLALAAEQLPPTLHYCSANPQVDFGGTPFVVNDQLSPWPRGTVPRRAGVSAFGFGGTNAHVIVEEAPQRLPSAQQAGPHLLVVSGRTAAACAANLETLATHLAAHPHSNLADVAATLRAGRRAPSAGLACLCGGDFSERRAGATGRSSACGAGRRGDVLQRRARRGIHVSRAGRAIPGDGHCPACTTAGISACLRRGGCRHAGRSRLRPAAMLVRR